MANTYTILVPMIVSAAFAINPVAINSKTVLEVFITEKAFEVQPEIIYSGEIRSGEV